jgi:hypothetical protein
MHAEDFEDSEAAVVVVEGVVAVEEAMVKKDLKEIPKRLDTATLSKPVIATEVTLASLPMQFSQKRSNHIIYWFLFSYSLLSFKSKFN